MSRRRSSSSVRRRGSRPRHRPQRHLHGQRRLGRGARAAVRAGRQVGRRRILTSSTSAGSRRMTTALEALGDRGRRRTIERAPGRPRAGGERRRDRRPWPAALRSGARTVSAGRSSTIAVVGTPAAAARARSARLAVELHARRIDHRQQAVGETARQLAVETREGGARRAAGPPRPPRPAPGSGQMRGSPSSAKWRAAKVDLPAPAAPISTTRLGSAMSISVIT